MEADCYQKIAKINEKLGDLNKAIEFLNKFLHMATEIKSQHAFRKKKEKTILKLRRNSNRLRHTSNWLTCSPRTATWSKQSNISTSCWKLRAIINFRRPLTWRGNRLVPCLRWVCYTTKRGMLKDQWTSYRSISNWLERTTRRPRVRSWSTKRE